MHHNRTVLYPANDFVVHINILDNGEFACGDILKNCLTKVEGFNVLICVSRHVDGMFVTDMVQAQKHRAVKEAAAKALELLKKHLTSGTKPAASTTLLSRDSFFFDSKQVDLKMPAIVPVLSNSPSIAENWKEDM